MIAACMAKVKEENVSVKIQKRVCCAAPIIAGFFALKTIDRVSSFSNKAVGVTAATITVFDLPQFVTCRCRSNGSKHWIWSCHLFFLKELELTHCAAFTGHDIAARSDS